MKLLQGFCEEKLKELADNSIDAVVTDPPYGLSKHEQEDVVACLKAWLNNEEYTHGSKGFMGKAWDSWVPSPMLWKEVYRVLKPGGHIACFAGTRTHDLMAISLRLAGFTLRETIMYVFGSGFPKSHNISKAIDKLNNAKREVIDTIKKTPSASSENMQDGWKRPWAENHPKTMDITVPATDDAKKWDGWGSALKPAYEPILLFRKPLEGTIVDNVLKHGVGGINIDECRVKMNTEDREAYNEKRFSFKNTQKNSGKNVSFNASPILSPEEKIENSKHGRFPTNIIHDGSDEVIKEFPESDHARGNVGEGNSGGGMYGHGLCKNNFGGGDSGSTARFFYCAKASQEDRDEGLNDFESRKALFADETNLHNNGDGTPRNKELSVKNYHPCLHPDSLVMTDTGLRKIIDISINDKVYTCDGKFNKVLDKTIHKYNENAYEIFVCGTNFSVTASHNHPFLIYRHERKNKAIINNKISWVKAEDVKKGDYTMTPVTKITDGFFKTNDLNYWFIVGFWLAEGSFTKAGHGNKKLNTWNKYPVFSLHKKEEEFIVNKLELLFHKDKIKKYEHGDNGKNIMVFDNDFSNELEMLCGHGAKTKSLNPLIYSLNENIKESFLNGYIFGDGCTIRNEIRIKTVSLNLVFQIKLLAESLNYCASFYKYDYTGQERSLKGTDRKIKLGILYQITLSKNNTEIKNRKPSRPVVIEHEGIMYNLKYVKKNVIKNYNGDVINLSVEHCPTFQTIIGMSHNTVKPTDLMKYVCKLITPKDGIILDPFMGSGSTGKAAMLEGFDFIGIEQDENYFKIAEARIKYAKETPKQQSLF